MLTSRLKSSARRTYTARLCCGIVLTYETSTFVPDVGAVVPCRRHGFCAVRSRDGGDGRGGGTARVVRRRSQSELIAFLSSRSDTSVHALRRQGFTLRLIAAAERDGLVDVDLVTGRVAVRVGNAGRSPLPDRSVTGGGRSLSALPPARGPSHRGVGRPGSRQ